MIDQLTNVSSRLALMEYIKSIQSGNAFLLDIDNFNIINGTYGYEIGDKVLIEVARLINLVKPESAKLFRLNSDEFVIISEETMNTKEVSFIASSIISFFDQMDISVSDIDVRVSFSIGVAVGSASKLLDHAKIAVQELRSHRRGAFKIYDPSSIYIQKQHENVYWVNKIKSAFMDENITTYYQPIINNETKKIEKYECLVRIIDDGIIISPMKFLEASKLTGTISLVTKKIIEQSFKKFSGTGYDFSINITATDLYLDYLEEYLLKHSKKQGIDPSRVVLEILEEINNINEPDILRQLDSLRSNGFKIAVDDFGNENSNFSRLLDFSPDYLKIDGSFIKNILTDNKSLIIVETIVHICKVSNIKIIAEFVHSEEVQNKVDELGIEYSQGYYFSEPKESID